MCATLGDGWYRGRLGWNPGHDRCVYGRDVALVAQLELELTDGTSHRIVTDSTWMATTAEIRAADLYDGSSIDLRRRIPGASHPGQDLGGWVPAAVVPFDRAVIVPRIAPPVRPVAGSSRSSRSRAPVGASSTTAARTSRASSACASAADEETR